MARKKKTDAEIDAESAATERKETEESAETVEPASEFERLMSACEDAGAEMVDSLKRYGAAQLALSAAIQTALEAFPDEPAQKRYFLELLPGWRKPPQSPPSAAQSDLDDASNDLRSLDDYTPEECVDTLPRVRRALVSAGAIPKKES